MNAQSPSRRQFLVAAAVMAAAAPLAPLLVGRAAAQALQPLPSDHATAVALAYTPDAATSKHASYKAGSSCSNCQFFTAANSGCSLFTGFAVAPAGWCSAWAKKA
jgi:hypothetical protein